MDGGLASLILEEAGGGPAATDSDTDADEGTRATAKKPNAQRSRTAAGESENDEDQDESSEDSDDDQTDEANDGTAENDEQSDGDTDDQDEGGEERQTDEDAWSAPRPESTLSRSMYFASVCHCRWLLPRLVVVRGRRGRLWLRPFTLPVARRIRGTLHAFDIAPLRGGMDSAPRVGDGCREVVIGQGDLIAEGFASKHGGFDAVLLFNILHTDNPEGMLRAAAELLRPDGWVLAIHWRSDVPTPRGPDLSIRPKPEQITSWAKNTGLLCAPEPAVLLPPWHFGIRSKRASV